MSKILVAEDSRTQALEIRMLLEDASFEVEVAEDGAAALDAMRRSAPDIVLTDLEMPRMNGLELVEAIQQDFAHIPVVLMTAHGSEEIAASALRNGAASYLPKSRLAQDVVSTLQRILELTNAQRQHFQALRCLRKSEFHFVLDNDPALIAPIINYLDEIVKMLELCGVNQRMRVGVALQEACLNAIHHGNLEVSSDLRQEDESIYHRMVQTRRAQAPYGQRRVMIDVNATTDEVAYTITDEGPGFDPSALPDPADAANLERIGGRGILLIRTFMDTVRHNVVGNSITMVKRREARSVADKDSA